MSEKLPTRELAVHAEKDSFFSGWLAAFKVYKEPRVFAMLLLGFSAGLPFMLVFSTLSAWLREAQIERATIGMLGWVGLAYTLKFFWSPVVDRFALPLLHRWLGRRRSWLLIAQIGIAGSLAGIAVQNPQDALLPFVLLALLTAFFSATQDIAVDAWRIEAAPQEKQGAMAAAYQLGYRVAIMVASAGALWVAADFGWKAAYMTMSALMVIGIITTFCIHEPYKTEKLLTRESGQKSNWLQESVIDPFADFFSRFGWKQAALILLFAGCYRLTDFTMGVMANPFYIDVGYTLKEIAAVAKGFGLFMSLLGVFIGGVAVARLGTHRALVVGIILVILSNLSFASLAFITDPGWAGLATVISADNLAMGVAGTALIAYLSSLTSAKYTATQYALFSSFYALPGKLAMGGSGFVVDAIGWPWFFVYTSALGLPALILLMFFIKPGHGAPTTKPA